MCGKLGQQPMSLLAGTGAGEKWGLMREGLGASGLEEGIGTLPPTSPRWPDLLFHILSTMTCALP